MALHLIALRKHGDVSKLHFEDGIRIAVRDRVDEMAEVHSVAVDFRAVDQAGLGRDEPSFDALMWVERDDDEVELDQPSLLDVAQPFGSWKIEATEYLPHHEDWVGAATPGIRVLYLFASQPSDPDMSDLLADASARMVDGALTSFEVVAGPPDLVGVAAFWFPRQSSLEAATQSAVFERIDSAAWSGQEAERLVTFERVVRERADDPPSFMLSESE